MSRIILSGYHAEELSLTANVPKLLDGSTAGRKADNVTGARLNVTITAGASDVYLGGPNLVAGTIPDIKAGGQLAMDSTGGLYALTAAGSTVRILEGF